MALMSIELLFEMKPTYHPSYWVNIVALYIFGFVVLRKPCIMKFVLTLQLTGVTATCVPRIELNSKRKLIYSLQFLSWEFVSEGKLLRQ